MQIFVNLKSIGRRRSGQAGQALEQTPRLLPDDLLAGGTTTLRTMLTALVEDEVAHYNAKGTETMLLPYLSSAQIDDQSTIGKVGFGRLYSEKKANAADAVNRALQGFEDGLFRVMVGDAEAKDLDLPLVLHEGDTLTFIRMTFLAGRLW